MPSSNSLDAKTGEATASDKISTHHHEYLFSFYIIASATLRNAIFHRKTVCEADDRR